MTQTEDEVILGLVSNRRQVTAGGHGTEGLCIVPTEFVHIVKITEHIGWIECPASGTR